MADAVGDELRYCKCAGRFSLRLHWKGDVRIDQNGKMKNMGRLYEGEEIIRKQSIAVIEADETLLKHVELIEAVMDHIRFFAKRDAIDLDQETVQLLGARMFDDLASAFGQLTRGYYQLAAATLRDVIEIVYLLAWFDRDPAKIAEWRHSDDNNRRKIFAPVKVRKFLDGFGGRLKKTKRGKAYKMFSEYAAHATWQDFALMRPTGSREMVIGPFFDASLMKAVLEETAMLAAQSSKYFAGFFDNTSEDVPALEVWLRSYVVTGEWVERYLGRPHDRKFVAAMEDYLLNLKAAKAAVAKLPH